MVDDRTFENLYNNSIHFPQEGAYNLYDPWRDVFLGFRRIDYNTNDSTAKYKRAAWSDGYRKQIESHIGTPIADVLNAYEATMFGDAAKLITGLSSTKRKREEQLVKMWSLYFRRSDFVDWMDIDSVIKFFTDNNWISLSRSLLAVRYKQQVLLVSGSMPVAVYGQRGFMLKQQAGELFEKDLMMLGIPYRIYKRLMRGDVVSW
jgi:hypothetical protein